MSYVDPGDIHILGSSPVFLDLLDRVSKVAPLDRPVLLIGERGTGKELIAARLHYLSGRWENRFVKLNCAALPETLLESELFGYEPGAFTGATHRRKGRFEAADEGSLFLDEIASMSASAQEKLLRVIEYGEFERVGGSETIRVDVRVLGAANIDLPTLAEKGEFRADLLDRLAFDVLTVPPLRARRDDIMELANHFARGIAHELEWTGFPGFSSEAREALLNYNWPGNVRELKNAVERAVYTCEEKDSVVEHINFDPFDSPYRPLGRTKPGKDQKGQSRDKQKGDEFSLPDARKPLDIKGAMKGIEKKLIRDALKANRFNQKATAKHLSLTYDQLRHAMKKHHLL